MFINKSHDANYSNVDITFNDGSHAYLCFEVPVPRDFFYDEFLADLSSGNIKANYTAGGMVNYMPPASLVSVRGATSNSGAVAVCGIGTEALRITNARYENGTGENFRVTNV